MPIFHYNVQYKTLGVCKKTTGPTGGSTGPTSGQWCPPAATTNPNPKLAVGGGPKYVFNLQPART